MMDSVLKKIGEIRLVPVVKIEDSRNALPLGQALKDGDLPIAEITYRTDAAEATIRALTSELPELLVGAGGDPGVLRHPGYLLRQGHAQEREVLVLPVGLLLARVGAADRGGELHQVPGAERIGGRGDRAALGIEQHDIERVVLRAGAVRTCV